MEYGDAAEETPPRPDAAGQGDRGDRGSGGSDAETCGSEMTSLQFQAVGKTVAFTPGDPGSRVARTCNAVQSRKASTRPGWGTGPRRVICSGKVT